MQVLDPHTILILIKHFQSSVVILLKQTHRIGGFYIMTSLGWSRFILSGIYQVN